MNLVVTGGSGFIGSNFIDYWISKHPDDTIINIDKLTYASNRWFNRKAESAPNYTFKKVDISDQALIEEVIGEPDCVINFAAESHVDRSIQDARKFIQSNILGVFNLVELARKRNFRFHQVSTDEVYGTLGDNKEEKFTRTSPYNPRNPYSATKASADFLVRSYVNTYGIRATISNCGNNFGPHQHPEKLIPKTILSTLSGLKIPLYGDGNQIRDWVFVEDHCSAIESILSKGRIGETYLVGSDNEVRNIDLVKMILSLLNGNKDQIELVPDRPGHDVRYSLSSQEIRKELGWNPIHTFEESLAKTVKHYIQYAETYAKMTDMNLIK